MAFPKGFAWGAAAASYQVEGAAYEDGRGISVWDTFCNVPDAIAQKETGEVSTDHYHKYAEDARMMGEMGLSAYRMSISWPRVLPDGVGRINQAGLDFYDRLVDALIENGVNPWVTLFHWDFPRELYLKGGWLNRDSADWFAEYTAVIVDKLSDRVSNWMTFNEPQCFIGLGHMTGVHAPGLKLPMCDVLQATHNVLRAHGKAVSTIHAKSVKKPSVGAAYVASIRVPDTNSHEDIEAARKCMFSSTIGFPWSNIWYTDPMILGTYPEEMVKIHEKDMPEIKSGDMETIHQPLDFYGVNTYTATRVRAGKNGEIEVVQPPTGFAQSTMGWLVEPEGLYWGPKFFYEHYGLPIVITENGMANCDTVSVDGKVHDPERIDYLTRYLREFSKAIDDGVDARGYFAWSVMDNFEWAMGYGKRFGLVYVDYKTKERILKDSAHWYREVAKSNGVSLYK
ncbi:MAG TPA: GH1 family beta-glucosidase [Armatimonadota bacterium]